MSDFVFEGETPLITGSPVENDHAHVRHDLITDLHYDGFVYVNNRLAASGSVVDDFESTSLSNYTGDTGQVSFVTSPVFAGDYAMRIDTDGTRDGVASLSGLPSYPEPGDTFIYYVYLTDSSDAPQIYFAIQSDTFGDNVFRPDDAYYVATSKDDNNYNNESRLVAGKRKNGEGEANTDTENATPCHFPTGEFLPVVVEWESSGFTAKTQGCEVSYFDDEFGIGGITMVANNRREAEKDPSTQYYGGWYIVDPA